MDISKLDIGRAQLIGVAHGERAAWYGLALHLK